MTLGRRLTRLEERQAAGATRPVEEPWWERVPTPVRDYLLAQDPSVAEAFGAHLDAMQDLPGNRDGFAYYQVLTRPWRPGERHFLAPALVVWDLIFRTDGRLTLGDARVRALACGFDNLRDAARAGADAPTPGQRVAEGVAAQGVARAAVWGRLAGGPLCTASPCLCFGSYWSACPDPRAPVAAWRARGATDPATLAAMGFGAAETALLALDDPDGTQTSEEGGEDAA